MTQSSARKDAHCLCITKGKGRSWSEMPGRGSCACLGGEGSSPLELVDLSQPGTPPGGSESPWELQGASLISVNI